MQEACKCSAAQKSRDEESIVSERGSDLHDAQAFPLLLQPPLLLLELLVAHAPAAVKARADCLQPLAQDQRLHTSKLAMNNDDDAITEVMPRRRVTRWRSSSNKAQHNPGIILCEDQYFTCPA